MKAILDWKNCLINLSFNELNQNTGHIIGAQKILIIFG